MKTPNEEVLRKILRDMEELILKPSEVARKSRQIGQYIDELHTKLRLVISHASGGHLSKPEDMHRSINDICVEISRVRNMMWEHAKEVGRNEAKP
jgi:hypothetical protein